MKTLARWAMYLCGAACFICGLALLFIEIVYVSDRWGVVGLFVSILFPPIVAVLIPLVTVLPAGGVLA
jgi:hypothetical protein